MDPRDASSSKNALKRLGFLYSEGRQEKEGSTWFCKCSVILGKFLLNRTHCLSHEVILGILSYITDSRSTNIGHFCHLHCSYFYSFPQICHLCGTLYTIKINLSKSNKSLFILNKYVDPKHFAAMYSQIQYSKVSFCSTCCNLPFRLP